MLLVNVLQNPHSLDVQIDIKLLKSVLQWTVRLKDKEGYDLVNLYTASPAMVRVAESPDAPAHAEFMVLRVCPCVLMDIWLIRSRSTVFNEESAELRHRFKSHVVRHTRGYLGGGYRMRSICSRYSKAAYLRFGIPDGILLHPAGR